MELGLHETPHRRALYNWCLTERPMESQGTPYPCFQAALDSCALGYNKPPHPLRSAETATILLERFLDPSVDLDSTVQRAIFRLRAGLRIQDWKPDLIVKAFYDLDIAFFDSALNCHTTFNWRCAPWWIESQRSPDAHRGPLGMTRTRGRRKAAIHLNAWGIFLDSPDDVKLTMWKVTLHEMVVS